MPAALRLRDLEILGEKFSMSQNKGIIMPHSDFRLNMYFIARNPVKLKMAMRYWRMKNKLFVIETLAVFTNMKVFNADKVNVIIIAVQVLVIDIYI